MTAPAHRTSEAAIDALLDRLPTGADVIVPMANGEAPRRGRPVVVSAARPRGATTGADGLSAARARDAREE